MSPAPLPFSEEKNRQIAGEFLTLARSRGHRLPRSENSILTALANRVDYRRRGSSDRPIIYIHWKALAEAAGVEKGIYYVAIRKLKERKLLAASSASINGFQQTGLELLDPPLLCEEPAHVDDGRLTPDCPGQFVLFVDSESKKLDSARAQLDSESKKMDSEPDLRNKDSLRELIPDADLKAAAAFGGEGQIDERVKALLGKGVEPENAHWLIFVKYPDVPAAEVIRLAGIYKPRREEPNPGGWFFNALKNPRAFHRGPDKATKAVANARAEGSQRKAEAMSAERIEQLREQRERCRRDRELQAEIRAAQAKPAPPPKSPAQIESDRKKYLAELQKEPI